MRSLVLASLCVALAVAFAAMPGLRYSPNNICPAATSVDECEGINAAKCTWYGFGVASVVFRVFRTLVVLWRNSRLHVL
jgi:hypothetical protein